MTSSTTPVGGVTIFSGIRMFGLIPCGTALFICAWYQSMAEWHVAIKRSPINQMWANVVVPIQVRTCDASRMEIAKSGVRSGRSFGARASQSRTS